MDYLNRFIDYLQSAKTELGKVTWPSKQETVRYSTLVIGASVTLAVFFAVLDYGLIKSVELIVTKRPTSVPTQPTTQEAPIDVQPVNVETETAPSGTKPQTAPAQPVDLTQPVIPNRF